MKQIAGELQNIVDDFSVRVNSIHDSQFSAKPLPDKWSKQEIFGHLIDSAHNNLRRFICSQYESAPPKITYDQDFWVQANHYHNVRREDIIVLWRLINMRICDVLKHMSEVNFTKECDTGKNNIQLHSLQWLAEDYIKHMKHHLNQILPGSFDIEH